MIRKFLDGIAWLLNTMETSVAVALLYEHRQRCGRGGSLGHMDGYLTWTGSWHGQLTWFRLGY